MPENARIVLIDGYAQIYRSYFAIRELSAPDGQPTNALYGVARFILRLDDQLPHAYGALVLDKGKPRKRLDILPEYKATRPSMPEDMRSQIALIVQWCEAMGWTILQEEGVEADDLIAAVVAAREGHDVAILSHDKDLGQLVQPGVQLLLPGKKGTMTVLDQKGVAEKFGVPPEMLRDYLALVGDTVDNIQGVSGVGPKTAAALLLRFGSIDGILSHTDAIERPALRDTLAGSADRLQRNRLLVSLDETLPTGWGGVEGLRRRSPDWEVLLEMARRFGFRSLTSDLEKRWSDERNPTLF